MATLRVGLTGGLASGKSTVAGWLAAVPGFLVVDADQLVAELYLPGGAGSHAVAELFGEEALAPGGGVDKGRLAARVFGDAKARAALEAAVHPLVRKRFTELAEAHPGVAVLEATLLVEAGDSGLFDQMISVEAPEEIRLVRAMARGLLAADAKSRIEAQGDGAARRAAADRILDSSGDLADLRRQVDLLVLELQRLASHPEARCRDQR